jgi:hypothetical protein
MPFALPVCGIRRRFHTTPGDTMFKRFVCATLIACSFGAHAGDWQQEFFSPMSNELPASRGVAVDDLGFVHLQAFNKQPWSSGYDLAHLYTFNAQGQAPWIWGLSSVNRTSDCGVYAKSGQRLDCFVTSGFNGDQTRLEMRSRYSAQIVWQTALPGEVKLLDASIPAENIALLVGKLTGIGGDELGVFRVSGGGTVDVLSISPACPQPGQVMISSRLRMPAQENGMIRHAKACWNSFGTTDLILEQFVPWTGQWTTLSTWVIPHGTRLTHSAINAGGEGFALVEQNSGFRELIHTHGFSGQWQPLPVPPLNAIVAFLANDRALAIVSRTSNKSAAAGADTVTRFDLQGAFWPNTQVFDGLQSIVPQGHALSSEGELIVVGYPGFSRTRLQSVWQANRYGKLTAVASLPFSMNEVTLGNMHVVGGPNNVAVVARNIERDGVQIGVRINQYALPF